MLLDFGANALPTPLLYRFLLNRLGFLFWPALGALILLLLLTGCALQPIHPVSLIPSECPLAVPDELEEGRTITCGYLQVLQDRTQPAGLLVKVPYAQIRAESANPHADPLVYIVGGPGGSALAEFSEIYPWFRLLRRDRDLILYDQRGTILADPVLECPLGGDAPTDEEIDTLSTHVPDYLHPIDANDVVVARCAQQLQAQGIDLSQYDTATHALDLIDLLAALGYSEYNLYGTSYGTRVALEVMRLAPDALRAVVLDSVYPPTINAYETQHALVALEVLQKSFDQCANDAACHAAYPNLAERFDVVVAQLNQQPLTLPLSWQPTFDGNDLLRLMISRLDTQLLPYMPQLIDELERGESELLVAVLYGKVPPSASPRMVAISAADEARVSEFVLTMNGALMMLQSELDATATHEWQHLTARNADRERLRTFIETYLPAEMVETLLAQLSQLTDADLTLAFAELRSVPIHPLTRGANLAVECRDEQPFNDYLRAISAHHAQGIPDELVADEIERLRHYWAQCILFRAGVASPIQNQAVNSDLPVLILQGALDTVTPPSWAAEAQRTLSNASYLEFPAQGHIVIQQQTSLSSGCAAQITRAFLDAPSQPPDTTCIDKYYQVPWVLPN